RRVLFRSYVIKRSGAYEPFMSYKIRDAITKGFESVSQQPDGAVYDVVMEALEHKNTWAVEEIQDCIETALYQRQHFQAMRSFMLYRHTRKLQREHIDGFNEDTTYVDSTQTIEEYINQTDWRINANANVSYSNAGLVNNTAGKVIANYWLDKVYSKE